MVKTVSSDAYCKLQTSEDRVCPELGGSYKGVVGADRRRKNGRVEERSYISVWQYSHVAGSRTVLIGFPIAVIKH